MIPPLTSDQFHGFKQLLLDSSGILLKENQSYLIENRLMNLARELGLTDYGKLLEQTKQNASLTQQMVDLMTTNETLWFRDQSCWNTIQGKILPELVRLMDQGREKVRIWSAASSTGQEAYSMAIMIDEYLGQHFKQAYKSRFEILGTDISASAVATASDGIFDPFSIARGLPDNKKEKYFTPLKEGFFQIKPEYKRGIRFIEFNLMNGFMPLGQFDLVLCRNVLIYFSDETKQDILRRIKNTLLPHGSLLMGATESTFGLELDYQTQNFQGGLYYTH